MTTSKRDAILNAMLDVVVEGGFHDAPMSQISKRSGASAGVIYHHFESKQDIISALYQQIMALKHSMLLQGYVPDMDARQAFIHVWMNAYQFYHQHRREMRFLEHYENAGFAVCGPEDNAAGQALSELERRFRGKAQGGVLNDWPVVVMQEMTLGLVARLAKLPDALAPAMLLEIAETLWDSVKAKE